MLGGGTCAKGSPACASASIVRPVSSGTGARCTPSLPSCRMRPRLRYPGRLRANGSGRCGGCDRDCTSNCTQHCRTPLICAKRTWGRVAKMKQAIICLTLLAVAIQTPGATAQDTSNVAVSDKVDQVAIGTREGTEGRHDQIGRASWRERGWSEGEMRVVVGSRKKKKYT